ncbi:2OG-Fe dioxygenase family protein [Marinomonas sp. C2222]|uniref:2OG-Fe dioxygenase family protein n=1 Tax=Marinomonas sargassi TaxID=2984494 RepID=A0ABT2YRK3_9GAMM|nr:2OG-Fe dioxygenase family protein [Marinomonas sargassi]MCV2402512.1 2OG-Fe dioxygenase family protein [Marinomonas sargassi]
MKNKLLLAAFQIPHNFHSELGMYFEQLPVDPYIDGDYRLRGYSRYQKKGDSYTRLPHTPFCQSSNINRLVGDVQRDFSPMDEHIDHTDELQHLLRSFAEYTLGGEDGVIEAHQIRVTCDAQQAGNPAPEGIHQDGFNFVGICCLKRQDISGGNTKIFTDSEGEDLHINTVLEEGQFIIFNDQRYYHYVSETLSEQQGKKGVRDVFVFTA